MGKSALPPPTSTSIMLLSLVVLSALSGVLSSPRFSCEECVREMHGLGGLIREAAPFIEEYLASNYCPTVDAHHCEENLTVDYVRALYAIVEHYFIDGALHVCQTEGCVRSMPESTRVQSVWP